jgi:hypothetical protein
MKINSPYSILRASIIMSSTSGESASVDIRNSIAEVRFYENLYKAYVDARLVLLDDAGLKDYLSMQGTERIYIAIGDPEKLNETIIEKTFFISKIADSKRVNDRSEVLSLELVEEHVYVNSVKKISRSFTSNIEEMVENICTNDLGKQIATPFFQNSAQGTRKVIVPYMNPLQSVYWMLSRATTRTGSPYFLSSDLYSNLLYLSDLDSLMATPVLNEKLPYRFSQASKSNSEDTEGTFYDLTSYESRNDENTLLLFESGAIGSFYENLDAATGISSGSHISVREILTEMYTNETIDDATTQSIFDPSLLIDGKLSDEYNSTYTHQVTSSGTYNQFASYHEEATLLDENNNLFESKLKAKNRIIRLMLMKNTIDVGLDGISLFKGKVNVGRRVRILFLNSDVLNEKANIADQIDKRKSGDYLILAISHKLFEESHDASMRLTKLGDLSKNFTL